MWFVLELTTMKGHVAGFTPVFSHLHCPGPSLIFTAQDHPSPLSLPSPSPEATHTHTHVFPLFARKPSGLIPLFRISSGNRMICVPLMKSITSMCLQGGATSCGQGQDAGLATS